MNEALDLIHETLNLFSGRRPLRETIQVNLIDESPKRERRNRPEKSFYSGNGRLIAGKSLDDLAEHLSDHRCMNFIRKAFVDILNGLEMSDEDRAYYAWAAGADE
jgi:hypothetical protein